MSRRYLRVEAPFAAYRWLQAGVYRASSPIMPPSAAYGLVMNLAGIETRGSLQEVVTPIRAGLPAVRLAVGLLAEPGKTTLYQQLHSYPVGNSGKDLALRTRGAKFWIVPVRRELVVDLKMVIGVDAPDPLLDQMARGLRGEGGPRYGIPFAGDNNLLFDRLEFMSALPPVRWYTLVDMQAPPRAGSCRLTVQISRTDSSQTTMPLFAPVDTPCEDPPEAAWVTVAP